VEKIMDEATDQLAAADTGGATLAAQTEIIEKIHAAAKEKQKQQGSGQSGSAMMDMMERMMGKTPDADKEGKAKGQKPSDTGGGGVTGSSDAANGETTGEAGGKSESQRHRRSCAARGIPQSPRCLQPWRDRKSEMTFSMIRPLPARSTMARLLAVSGLMLFSGIAPGQDLQGRQDDTIPAQAELIYERGLKFLAKTQSDKGNWNDSVGGEPGVVGLCVAAFLAHGEDPNYGPYSKNIRQGIDFILSQQSDKNGYIGSSMCSTIPGSPPRSRRRWS
jgi:hypothetical protein